MVWGVSITSTSALTADGGIIVRGDGWGLELQKADQYAVGTLLVGNSTVVVSNLWMNYNNPRGSTHQWTEPVNHCNYHWRA